MAVPVIEEYRLRARQRTDGPRWSQWTPRKAGREENYCGNDCYDYQFRLVHDGKVIAGPVDVDPKKVRPGDPVNYGLDDEDISVATLRGIAIEAEEIVRPAKPGPEQKLANGEMKVDLQQDFSDTIPVTVGGVGGKQIGHGVLNADGSFEAMITDKEVAEKLLPPGNRRGPLAGIRMMSRLVNALDDHREAPKPTFQVGGTHYQTGDHEPFLVIDEWSEAWPKPAVFYLACAVKYIARLGRKGDEESWKQDLDKAVHYLQEAKKRI